MKTIISITESKVVIKVSGSDVTETIALADLVPSSGTQVATGPYKVSLNQVSWSAVGSGSFAIKRNSVTIVAGSSTGTIDFENLISADHSEEDKDITVTTTGECYVYFMLRKNGGYENKLTPWRHGQYDDPLDVNK